jgi:excisionase family DNA binding protein
MEGAMVDTPHSTNSVGDGRGTGGERKPHPTMLTLTQVAAQLQVSTKTVRRLIAKLAVPHVLVGAQIRIPVEHVHLLVNKRW